MDELSDAEFLATRLRLVARKVGIAIHPDWGFQKVADLSGVILAAIARKLDAPEAKPKPPTSDLKLEMVRVGSNVVYSLAVGGDKFICQAKTIEHMHYVEVTELSVWEATDRRKGYGRYMLDLIQAITKSDLHLDASPSARKFYLVVGFTPGTGLTMHRPYK